MAELFLLTALAFQDSLIPQVHALVNYCDAEGLDNSEFLKKKIAGDWARRRGRKQKAKP